MATPTDGNRDLVTVIAHMRAAEGKEQELRTALESLVEPTSREQGFVNYDMHQGIEDPAVFYFYENWETLDDHDTHMQAPHLTAFAGRLDDLLDENGLTVTRLRRVA